MAATSRLKQILLARVESAYSFILGAYQIWGNVLAILWQLDGAQSADLFVSFVILRSYTRCRHANVTDFATSFLPTAYGV